MRYTGRIEAVNRVDPSTGLFPRRRVVSFNNFIRFQKKETLFFYYFTFYLLSLFLILLALAHWWPALRLFSSLFFLLHTTAMFIYESRSCRPVLCRISYTCVNTLSFMGGPGLPTGSKVSLRSPVLGRWENTRALSAVPSNEIVMNDTPGTGRQRSATPTEERERLALMKPAGPHFSWIIFPLFPSQNLFCYTFRRAAEIAMTRW